MGKTPTPAETDRYLVPGLVRGLEVLRAFTAERPRMTQAELAAALGVSRSAIFRVVYTLAELGFLLPDPGTRAYTLGPATLQLGAGVGSMRNLLARALPALEALRDATGWSTHLGVLEGRAVVYLLRLPARRATPSIVHVGSRLPAEVTAMGRVLLAGLGDAELLALLRETTGPGSPAALLRRARLDRARGHVVHRGEFEAGIASIAAPLRDASGRTIAAINATARLAEAPEARRAEATAAVLRAAAALSRALGAA
jgi:DNA-binding IclR family transcriptional regulator